MVRVCASIVRDVVMRDRQEKVLCELEVSGLAEICTCES